MSNKRQKVQESGSGRGSELKYLAEIGRRVRTARGEMGMTRKELADASGVSERYLAQLEAGRGNISVLLLRKVAKTLQTSASELVAEVSAQEMSGARGRVALIGMRGAGKSTLGAMLAAEMKIPFVELDRMIERESGMKLGALFDLYGAPGFHRLERKCLEAVLQKYPKFVLAAGGSIVNEAATLERLLTSCFTVWLKAKPEEHMQRVIAQGDRRPMARSRQAMQELKSILAGREPSYRRAHVTVDTSGKGVKQSLGELSEVLR